METIVKIVFVGLVSFVTLNGQSPDVVIVKATGHVPFIAFNATTVKMTCTSEDTTPCPKPKQPPNPSGDPALNGFRIVELAGVNVDNFAPGTAKVPDSVAKLSDFWPSCNCTPLQQYTKKPDSQLVAGIVKLGAGSLTAQRPTGVEFQFRDKNKTATDRARFYAREVAYRDFQKVPNKSIKINLKKFGSTTGLVLTFSPAKSDGDVEIKIGNGSDLQWLLLEKDPLCYNAGTHMHWVYDILGKKDGPIPYPLEVCFPADGSGYCGPDQVP